MTEYLPYSILAGICGALGGVFSKLTFSLEEKLTNSIFWICLFFFVLFNVLMWWSYTRSLAKSSSTITPMIVNMGINFSVTGVIGIFLFKEYHSFMWWIGLIVVISGISMMGTQEKQNKE